MAGIAESLGIEHVFVLMLENRSFDHLLGFSGITGTDAATGGNTSINGLSGTESNIYNGQTYTVSPGASFRVASDPAHEFPDVLEQLCGPDAVYTPGGPYPAINDSGFVAAYVAGGGQNPKDILRCYAPEQLPVLNALAREFVVCDNWHASMPGPTWPNRMFVHAASSGGLDHSPTTLDIVKWETIDGFPLKNGTIFDLLRNAGVTRCLYAGDDFPMVSAIKGIHLDDIRQYSCLETDLQQPSYPYRYIFIEPSYDVLNDYRDGTSEHPLGDVTRGEALIKATYEAIRNSAFWGKSVLILTWDEHGGFFDHAIPPLAPAPGDTDASSKYNQYGFTFQQYGARVPAVIISPLIPKNRIDHRLYDHASIPATVEALFGLPSLTARDAAANRLDTLFTLSTPRTDCPQTLPKPAVSNAIPAANVTSAAAPAAAVTDKPVTRPAGDVDQGNLPAIIHAAMRQQLSVAPQLCHQLVKRVAAIETREDALKFLKDVQQNVRPLRKDLAAC